MIKILKWKNILKYKTIELKAIYYVFNVVNQKQIYYTSSFDINEELLDAINEQFLEIGDK